MFYDYSSFVNSDWSVEDARNLGRFENGQTEVMKNLA